VHPSLLANDGNQQCCRQLHAVTGRTLVHPDLAIGFVGSSFQLATAVGPACVSDRSMFCRTRILQRMVDVCFAVAIARPELAHYSRLHKLWPSNFGRGMLRGETVPRSIERYRTIIEVNRVAIVETAPEKVFCGMCAALKKVMPCDRAGLTVYDPEHDALKIAALYGRYENSFFHVGDFLRRNDSQNGWTFEHQSRTLRRDLAKEHQFALEKHTLEEGFQSLCSVPLVVYGKGVGVVTILSQQKNQYSHRDGEYLQDVANQIALLVAMLAPHCTHHPQSKLVCPRCIASAGGRTTTAKYKEQLSAWGQKGGRRKKEGGELS